MSRAPPAEEMKSTCSPSAAQTGLVLRWLSSVMRTGSPPDAGITHIELAARLPSVAPDRGTALPQLTCRRKFSAIPLAEAETYATIYPSGETAGYSSTPGALVT